MPSKTHEGYSALMVWIPEELHNKFKLYCVQNKTSIKAVTIDFLQRLLGDTDEHRENSKTDETK